MCTCYSCIVSSVKMSLFRLMWILYHISLLRILPCQEGACGRQSGELQCCNDFILQNGVCELCPRGWFGKDCTYPCPKELYGRACRNKCECMYDQCDSITGCAQKGTNVATHVTRRLAATASTTMNKMRGSSQNDTTYMQTTETSLPAADIETTTNHWYMYAVLSVGFLLILVLLCAVYKHVRKNSPPHVTASSRMYSLRTNTNAIQSSERILIHNNMDVGKVYKEQKVHMGFWQRDKTRSHDASDHIDECSDSYITPVSVSECPPSPKGDINAEYTEIVHLNEEVGGYENCHQYIEVIDVGPVTMDASEKDKNTTE